MIEITELKKINEKLNKNIELFTKYIIEKNKVSVVKDENDLLQKIMMKRAALVIVIREGDIQRDFEDIINIQVLLSDIEVFNNIIEKTIIS